MTSGMFPNVRFGVHTGLQHTTYDVLQPLWQRIEELGFDWISIWDHFYGATGKPDDAACYEAGLKEGMYLWLQNFGQAK